MGEIAVAVCSDGSYCCVHLSEGGDCSDTEEDECIPEILDPQKALEYLVSERDIEHAYNNFNYGDKQKQHTTKIKITYYNYYRIK